MSAFKTTDWRYWLGLIILAIIMRVLSAFLFLRSMPLVNDALDYSRQALRLVHDFPGPNAYYWPPGLPLALNMVYIIFGPNIWVGRILMLLFSVLCVVLTVLVAGQLLVKGLGARHTGWLSAFYMPAILMVGQTYSQHLTSLCLLAVAYFGRLALERKRLLYFIISGIAYGVGSLTRPSMMSVGLVVLIVFIRTIIKQKHDEFTISVRRIAIGTLIFLGFAGACILPVQWHNYFVGAGWTISTNNERNFFLGNNPYTPNYKTSHLASRFLDQLDPEVRKYLESFYHRKDSRSAMMGAAINFMWKHPMTTLYRILNRARAFWGFDYVMSREIQKYMGFGNIGLIGLLLLEAGGYFLVMLLVSLGITCCWKNMMPLWSFWLIMLVIGYEIPYLIAFADGNFHFPVMGLLMPFAGAILEKLCTVDGRRDTWITLQKNKFVWVSIVVFVFIQLEYAYYVIRMVE